MGADSKLPSLFILIVMGIALCSCENDDKYSYDKGYRSAWNGEDEPGLFSSKQHKTGYQQGLEDAAAYDDGYYDGYNKKKARCSKDPDYMDGFKDGCKKRKW